MDFNFLSLFLSAGCHASLPHSTSTNRILQKNHLNGNTFLWKTFLGNILLYRFSYLHFTFLSFGVLFEWFRLLSFSSENPNVTDFVYHLIFDKEFMHTFKCPRSLSLADCTRNLISNIQMMFFITAAVCLSRFACNSISKSNENYNYLPLAYLLCVHDVHWLEWK